MRWFIGGLFVLLGPGMVIAYGVWRFTTENPYDATATATVVDLKRYDGANHSKTTCPILEWSTGSEVVRAESNRCDLGLSPGDTLSIEYDASNPDEVKPVGSADHPEQFPIAFFGAICTAIAAFFLWPTKKAT